jgi:hypothetical protein
MNFEENNMHEAFDRYVTGQMSEGEKAVFLEELDRDPALKAAFDTYINIVAGIRDARRDELKDYLKRNTKIRYIGNVWSRSWVIASAAIVTIFLGAYVMLNYYSANQKGEGIVLTDTSRKEKDSGMEGLQDIAIEQDQVAHNEHTGEDERTDNGAPPAAHEDATGKPQKTIPYYILERKIDVNPSQVAEKKITGEQKLDITYEPGDAYMYKYNKSTLVLYRIPEADKKSVYEYNRSAYLSWNKGYYLLKPDGKSHPLEAVKDSVVIKSLPPVK